MISYFSFTRTCVTCVHDKYVVNSINGFKDKIYDFGEKKHRHSFIHKECFF